MENKLSNSPLLLGTRASELAKWQARWVAGRLEELGHEVTLVPIVTHGDQNQEVKIGEIGSQNVFTKEIQQALLDHRIDLAVHSLKDLSTETVDGLTLAAVPRRGPVGDVLVRPAGGGVESLGEAAIVGTGSPRRKSQLLHVRPDLRISGIRGNVDTRLKKLESGLYEATVLAEAGLRRLGLDRWVDATIPFDTMLPAVGQGALGIEIRDDDDTARAAVAALDDPKTRAAVTAERAMMAAIEGGCQTPIAAYARVENGRLVLDGRVLSLDGQRRIDATGSLDAMHAAAKLGRRVAEELLEKGAGELIHEARGGTDAEE